MLTAIDGDLKSHAAPDAFRIKIWDRATDEVVYDNQMGASDDGDDATELGGGSIVIHQGDQMQTASARAGGALISSACAVVTAAGALNRAL